MKISWFLLQVSNSSAEEENPRPNMATVLTGERDLLGKFQQRIQKKEEKQSYLFDTEGELPRIGETVYVNDWRNGINVRKTYIVSESWRCISLDKIAIQDLDLKTTTAEDRLHEGELEVKNRGCFPFGMKFGESPGFEVSRQEGQVILKEKK